MPEKSWSQHQQDVNDISGDLKQACAERVSVDWSRDAMPHGTKKSRKGSYVVKTAALNGILGIEGNSVWVEPGVTMEQLCRWTLSKGFIPPVVPEFKGITVGGAVMGAGLESSSFREGQFSDSCDAYELILGNGQVLQAGPAQNAELFYGVSGSYGSIARLALAKVRLTPAKPLVRLSYHVVNGHEQIPSRLDALCDMAPRPDYVDGIVLDEQRAVLIVGYRVEADAVPVGVNVTTFEAYWKPWFIQHVLEKVKQQTVTDDYLPLWDYLFRFDRGAFWMGQFVTNRRSLLRYFTRYDLNSPGLKSFLERAESKYAPTLSPSLLFRATCGWMLSSRSMYQVLHRLPMETLAQKYLIQDFYVPTKAIGTFLEYVRTKVSIYPLWLCPMRGAETGQILSPHYLTGPNRHPLPDFVNVGVYGVPKNGQDIPTVTCELEGFVHTLGGRKMLYAINYIPQETFWQVYNWDKYQELRAGSGLENTLREFYEKTHGQSRANCQTTG